MSKRFFGSMLKQIKSFDQTKLGLAKSFNLLDYAQLKG
jgi:hypothetical protein